MHLANEPIQKNLANRDLVLLVARCLIVLLFVLFGWQKFSGFPSAVGYMAGQGLPLPAVAAGIAVAMEFFVGITIAAGLTTRPLVLLLAVYTLATAFIARHYWTMSGSAHFQAEINFHKNISIIGGLLAIYASGPGRYSVDKMLGWI